MPSCSCLHNKGSAPLQHKDSETASLCCVSLMLNRHFFPADSIRVHTQNGTKGVQMCTMPSYLKEELRLTLDQVLNNPQKLQDSALRFCLKVGQRTVDEKLFSFRSTNRFLFYCCFLMKPTYFLLSQHNKVMVSCEKLLQYALISV